MSMPEEVSRAADALLDALRGTDAFQEYEALKQSGGIYQKIYETQSGSQEVTVS